MKQRLVTEEGGYKQRLPRKVAIQLQLGTRIVIHLANIAAKQFLKSRLLYTFFLPIYLSEFIEMAIILYL